MFNCLTIRFPKNSNKDKILKNINEEIMKNLLLNDKIKLLSNTRIFILKKNSDYIFSNDILLIYEDIDVNNIKYDYSNDYFIYCNMVFDEDVDNIKYAYSYDYFIDPRFMEIDYEINKKYIELMTEIENLHMLKK